TVGFDKEHTVAVWAGNFDGRPMRDTLAVRAATPLWAAVMQELLRRDHPLEPPMETEQLMRREICKATGLRPSRFSPAILSELFLSGTEPREDSADYFASDGKLLLPAAYTCWCASRDNTIGAHVRSDFRITSPPPNARYEIDPVLPPSQQMVELTAAVASDVEWFVNNERIVTQHDSRFFWQLAPGEWRVRAVSRVGTAEETITVEYNRFSWWRRLCSSCRGAFPRSRIQNAFAQTKRFWRRFDVLIYVDVFDRTLEAHAQRGFKLNPFTFALASHVGEVFFPARIDWQILQSRVFTYDHSFVNVLLRSNEKPAALLNAVKRISSADPRFHRHHHTASASADFTLERRVFAKEVTH